MDLFAAEIGMDPVDVRRRNLIPKFDEPHTTTIGQTYDVGDYETALDKALGAAGYAELRAEQAARRRQRRPRAARHRRERATSRSPAARRQLHEDARIELREDGGAVVYTGTSPHGQGHVTAWSMIASSETGIPMDQIDVRLGRHRPRVRRAAARWARGRSSRAARPCTSPPRRSSRPPRTSPPGCSRPTPPTWCSTPTRGAFHVAGTPAVAQTWAERGRRRRSRRAGSARRRPFTAASATFPFGCPRRRGRGRHRDGQGAPPPPRGAATTPDGSSTRCSSRARSTAASRRARRRRCWRRSATTRTATRSPPTWPTTPSSRRPSCPASRSSTWRRRRPSTRWAPRASASRAPSAPPPPSSRP